MKDRFIPLLSVVVMLGCAADTVAPVPIDGSYSASPAACQALQFSASMSFGPTGFAGTVTGDLEGTISVVFAQNPTVHGVASLNNGTDFIDVTGGRFPDVIGTTIEHPHGDLAVFAPGLGDVGRINGHGRLVGHVGGRLTFHGTILNGFPFPVELTYRGNICIG